MCYSRPIKFRSSQPSRKVTHEQIIELLVFLRDVYPSLTHKKLTAARLYAVVKLLTETGIRSSEVLNLDVLGDERGIFYSKKLIRVRLGKGNNSFGSQMRVVLLSRRSETTLLHYERVVRPHFRNQVNDPLFLDRKGTRLSYGTLRRDFARLVEAASKHGVNVPRKLAIHELRRTFVTNFLELNRPGQPSNSSGTTRS